MFPDVLDGLYDKLSCIMHFPFPSGMFNTMPQCGGRVEYPLVPILLTGNVAEAKGNQPGLQKEKKLHLSLFLQAPSDPLDQVG